jgi:predicted transcriptional regulator
MKSRKATLTDQELEIMKVVWERGTATVRDVYEELLRHRRIAYTTVMTMMGILEQKGHLKRSADGRAYVYRPAQPKAKVVGNMVQDFVKRVFDGSAQPLLVHLVESPEIDEDQLKQIEALLRERRRKQ